MFTYSIAKPIQHYVEKNWVNSYDCVKREVFARGAHLALVPISTVTSALDTIVGSLAGLGAIGTAGLHKPTVELYRRNIDSSRKIAARPFVSFLKFINPAAKFSGDENFVRRPSYDSDYFDGDEDYNKPKISGDGNGFITNGVRKYMSKAAIEFSFSQNVFKRHVLSRLTYALMGIASLVTRAVDGAIGLVAAAFSIITAGKFESLNNLAYRGLQAPGIIDDLFSSAIKFINPWAGMYR